MRRFACYGYTIDRGFNPRICKRCDLKLGQYHIAKLVSIHASVKDATYLQFVFRFYHIVSIHASVKDATSNIFEICKIIRVSIHASVKDATIEQNGYTRRNRVSIHASVKDATIERRKLYGGVRRFQSTHL